MPPPSLAVILKEPDTHYLATVPDFGACFSIGKTIEEAKSGLPDALTLHIDGMKAGGLPLPSPRSRAAVLAALDEAVATDYVIEIEPGNSVSSAATPHAHLGKSAR